MSTRPRLVLTMGDPAGIGPEIIVRALSRPGIRRKARYCVLGNVRILEEAAERLGITAPLRTIEPEGKIFDRLPGILQTDQLGGSPLRPGAWSVRTGRASLSYILKATHLCLDGAADAMVTAPVCKEALKQAGCIYPGHTEFIADLCGAEKVVMMLVGGGLRVALVTTHAAVAALPQLVTRGEVAAAIMVTYRELRERFAIDKPRIAVLGLNPHAGEGGLFGDEERRHIVPGMKVARMRGCPSIGPLPADTAFHRMLKGDFDAVLAMYHDQGLGPLKTVAFDTGVNVTLGLPIIRTSVDHGTAFDIAGKGIASESSLVAAIDLAVRLCASRRDHTQPETT